MRLITRLETPAEVTNQLETCGHLTPCNGIHSNSVIKANQALPIHTQE